MVKVDVDEFFNVYDYVTALNKEDFSNLDLSDFFANADSDMKNKIKEKYTKLNNFNRIYILSAFEQNRNELGLILNTPTKNN